MTKVEVARQAQRDLRRIEQLLVKEAGPRTALKWIVRLTNAFQSLASRPEQGQVDEQLAGRRRLVVAPYLIVYRLAAADRLVVLRVVDGRRDLPKLFSAPDAV